MQCRDPEMVFLYSQKALNSRNRLIRQRTHVQAVAAIIKGDQEPCLVEAKENLSA